MPLGDWLEEIFGLWLVSETLTPRGPSSNTRDRGLLGQLVSHAVGKLCHGTGETLRGQGIYEIARD